MRALLEPLSPYLYRAVSMVWLGVKGLQGLEPPWQCSQLKEQGQDNANYRKHGGDLLQAKTGKHLCAYLQIVCRRAPGLGGLLALQLGRQRRACPVQCAACQSPEAFQ